MNKVGTKKYKSRYLVNTFFFITLFFSIFGPKIFGVLDLTVLVPLLLVAILIAQNSQFLKLDKYLIFLVGFSFFIYFQLLAFNFLEHVEDPHFLVRNFRALFSEILVFVLIYSIVKRGLISHETIFKLITLTFSIGAFVVYLQAFFPQTQAIFAELWGFNKSFRYLRGFGLSSGYDTTGYLLCWSAAVILLRWLRFGDKSSFIPFLFIAGAVLFTSRTSMVMLIGLCGLVVLSSRSYYKIFSFSTMALVSVGFSFVYLVIYPIIAGSVFGARVVTSVLVGTVSDRFATTDLAETAGFHYKLPDTEFGIMFGVGLDPLVDPGYIIAIFRGGLLLLFTFLLFYLFSVLHVRKVFKNTSKSLVSINHGKWMGIWVSGISLLFVIIIIANFKNLYFFTRGYHELFVLLVAVSLGFCHKAKTNLGKGAVSK